jgi:hypothetical protein
LGELVDDGWGYGSSSQRSLYLYSWVKDSYTIDFCTKDLNTII